MAGFEHLLKSFDVGDQLDDIASSDPPAYLRRCFAEGISTPELTYRRVQQLAVCAMVLDSILNDRDYDAFEPELISDWRAHHAGACTHIRANAHAALRRAQETVRGLDPDAAAELEALANCLVPA